MRLRDTTISLLNFFIGAVEAILGLRFFLKLFGANAGNNFVSWIYSMSDGLLDPFRGIFPAHVLENRYVLEFTTLFAMLMYGILALLIMALITAVTRPVVADTTVIKKRR